MGVLVDYEGAWDEFQEFLLTRDGWGTRTLLAEMASLRVKHKIQSDPATTDPAGTSRRPRAVPDANEDPKEDRDGHAEHEQRPLANAG